MAPKKAKEIESLNALMGGKKMHPHYPFPCLHCEVDPLLDEGSLRKHNVQEHRKFEFECTICCNVFESLAGLRGHVEDKHEIKGKAVHPQPAMSIRKGGLIVIENRPCEVIDILTCKAGKHGHTKCHFTGVDLFSGKQLEVIVHSGEKCDVPDVVYTEYNVIGLSRDGVLRMETGGCVFEHMRVHMDDFATQIRAGIDARSHGVVTEIVVTTICSMGQEKLQGVNVSVCKGYTLLDISDDGFVTLLDPDDYTEKNDFVPLSNDPLSSRIKQCFKEGKMVTVNVSSERKICAMEFEE